MPIKTKEINPKIKLAVINIHYCTVLFFDNSYILTQTIKTRITILLIVNNMRLDN